MQQVLSRTGGVECVEERSQFVSTRCVCAHASAAGGKIPVGTDVQCGGSWVGGWGLLQGGDT